MPPKSKQLFTSQQAAGGLVGGKLLGQPCPDRITGCLSAPGTKRSKNQTVLWCLAAACLALLSVQFRTSHLWLRIASVPWGERHKKLIKSEYPGGKGPTRVMESNSWVPKGSPKKIRPCVCSAFLLCSPSQEVSSV